VGSFPGNWDLPALPKMQSSNHLERIAFNALPTQVTDNFDARQYYQQLNQVEVSKKDKKTANIKDIDIYEFVDDSLRIVPPKDNFGEDHLIYYAKSDAPKKIGELEDILSRNIPYASSKAKLHETVNLPEMEPGVCNDEIVKFPPYRLLNWSNISANRGKDGENLLYLLKHDFNLKWANSDNSTIYGQVDVINRTNMISYLLGMIWPDVSAKSSCGKNLPELLERHLNNTWYIPNSWNINLRHLEGKDRINELVIIKNKDEYSDDCVQIQLNNSTMNKGKAIMNISGLTTYDLDFINEKGNEEKGKWIYDWNGLLKFHVNDLSSRDRLVYWYYVKPKKSALLSPQYGRGL